ncbi:restriction endonuclease subunit S [Pseudoalteromonas atlantica]|uniref:restriction endonuclease subunit S n=1 Tax=Pseudoalteromonas atlantica TaxID=288 RepID=UPI000BBC6450|nr:restriction endonuclease subunit S [Pseudoalteromonas atlantica]
MSALEQNIPKGFKQTEVGIIPQEWQILTIDEAISSKMIFDQMDGNHGELYPKSHEFKDDGIPYVGATDFYSGKIDYKHCKRLPLKRAKLFKKGVAKDGDVLFAHNATVGPSSLVETHEDFIIISTTATYYRCNDEKIKNTYLLNFFRSKLFESQYSSVMSQSTRNQVPILAQRKFYLALPHIKEQTAIANALSDVDALLAELEKMIAKKQAIKTATMQQLLTGKTRLPQFATYTEDEKRGQPKGTKPSELGEIPEDWDVVSIAKLTRNIIDYRGRTPKKLGMDWGGGDIVALSAGNVKKGYIDFEEECYLGSDELYKKWMKNGDVEQNDIVFTMEAPLGNVALVPDSKRYILSQRTILLQLKREEYESTFVYQLMMSDQFQKLLSDSATGSTAQGIKRTRFEQLLLCLPNSKEEQTAIATILSDMDNGIQTLEQRLAKTRQIKQGMMQELLTGRTRLPFEKE